MAQVVAAATSACRAYRLDERLQLRAVRCTNPLH